jgi:uncharacterized protein
MVYTILNFIAFILVMVGSLNWGLVGIFDYNLVSAIFGAGMNVGSSIIYILVLLSAIWLIFIAFYKHGIISLMDETSNNKQ